jgi:nucleoside-diphosphate-sugar epimerase
MGMVDVRDVARAHFLAMITPQASGRYLVNAKSCYLLVEACKILRKAYPERWVPPLFAPPVATILVGPVCGLSSSLAKAMCGKVPKIDASKAAKDLGMTQESYIDPKVTILEMAEDLIQKGLVPKFVTPAVPKFFISLFLGIGVCAVLGLTLMKLVF